MAVVPVVAKHEVLTLLHGVRPLLFESGNGRIVEEQVARITEEFELELAFVTLAVALEDVLPDRTPRHLPAVDRHLASRDRDAVTAKPDDALHEELVRVLGVLEHHDGTAHGRLVETVREDVLAGRERRVHRARWLLVG